MHGPSFGVAFAYFVRESSGELDQPQQAAAEEPYGGGDGDWTVLNAVNMKRILRFRTEQRISTERL